MHTCTKKFTDIPFAHRQHLHDGHCSYVHGHNWTLILTFGCGALDRNGFVIDLGRLRFLKGWIEKNLDHACVFNEDDPLREALVGAAPEAWKIYIVPNCSCEGLAEHLFGVFDRLVRENTGDRAFLVAIEIEEDAKNSAAYRPS